MLPALVVQVGVQVIILCFQLWAILARLAGAICLLGRCLGCLRITDAGWPQHLLARHVARHHNMMHSSTGLQIVDINAHWG